MNNEPVAWMENYKGEPNNLDWDKNNLYCEGEFHNVVPLYTHPVKDREKDRLRFSDEAFNRWLDESISDSGHTVYDLVENVCEAWHGWENSQYYTHPVKELTDEEITEIYYPFSLAKYQFNMASPMFDTLGFARAILRKANEK